MKIAMKRILVTVALMCMAICSYAQRDIPAGGCMDVASVETSNSIGDNVGFGKQVTLYKVKDNEGNPSFLLSISGVSLSLSVGTDISSSTLSIPTGGVLLDFGLSVFPSREPGVSGNFWVSYEGCQVPFRTSGRIMGLPLRRRSGQGPHLAKTLEPRVFSRFAVGFSSDDGDYRLPPLLALGSPVFHSSGEGKLGAALSHCRAKETSSRRVSRT